MLDYTNISSKIEDVKNALNDLDELVYSQYNGIFEGVDDIIYERIRELIQSAHRYMDIVDCHNNRLSDAFEEKLHGVYMTLEEEFTGKCRAHEKLRRQLDNVGSEDKNAEDSN